MVNPILIPFAGAGALSQASGVILEKKILRRKKKSDFRSYTAYHFIGIIVAMLPFIWFFWKLSPEALEIKNIAIMIGIVAASIIANLLNFYSYKRERITELEPMKLFEPLFVILLAVMIYTAERETSIGVLIAAFIASLALIFSHIKKHHLSMNKYMMAALAGAFFFALELVLARAILPFYNPITFYFIRCSLVFLAAFAILRPKPSSIDKAAWIHIFIIGIIWAIYRILIYYGYLNFGVIFTTLLFILAPLLIYLFAKIFLKEKLTWRNIVATAVILACVAYAISVA